MSHSTDFPACLGQQRMTLIREDGRNFYVAPRVAPIFQAFLHTIVQRGYRIGMGVLDDWSYNCRDIRDSTAVSEHARGTAVDINATTNPMGSRLRTDMPYWVPVVAKQYGLRWGGDYSTRKDAMHFEFMGTAADADRIVRDVVRAPLPQPKEDDGITPSDSREAIRFLQVCLTLGGWPVPADGVYGTLTGQKVRNAKAFANDHRNPGAHVFDLGDAQGWKAGPEFLKWLAQWLNFRKSQGAF